MSTNNKTSSDLTMKRQTRMQFANYIIQEQAFANGIQNRIKLEGGSAAVKAASTSTDIKQGERSTTVTERDAILASAGFPPTTSSSGGSSEPLPPVPSSQSGTAVWGLRNNSAVTSTSATVQNRTTWVDNDGNVYLGGFYNRQKLTVNSYSSKSGTSISVSAFGLLPQPPTTINHSFIIKYNSEGVAQWATTVAATTYSLCTHLTTDSNGNVYTLHVFRGTATVNSYGGGGGSGGDITLTAYGTSLLGSADDTLIVKHNSSGVVQWMAQITGAGNQSVFNGNSKNIGIDSDGSILFTMSAVSATFTLKSFSSGGGGGATTFTDFGSFTGTQGSLYVCKINSSGVFQWVSLIKSTTSNGGADFSTAVDSNNNVYIAFTCDYNISLESYNSVTSGTINFTPWGTATRLTTDIFTNNRDAFIAKLNSSGAFQACARFATDLRYVNESSIAIDASNNVITTFRYYAGTYNAANKMNIYSFSGTDPAGGAIGFTAWGSLPVIAADAVGSAGDACILKFDSNLTTQSAIYMSSSTESVSNRRVSIAAVDTDNENNIYVNLFFNGSAITFYNYSSGGGGLDTNITTTTFGAVANAAGIGIFNSALVKFNSSLQTQWATRINASGVTASLQADSICIDRANGFVYYSGYSFANNTVGFVLNDYGGVSGGSVILNTFGSISSGSTSSTGITQSILAKYKV